MKKLILSLFCTTLLFNLFADDTHKDVNPNITPFHDAVESQDGFKFSKLRNQPSWKIFTQKYKDWGATFDRRTQLPHRAFGTPISFALGGNDVVAKAKAFLAQELAGFELPIQEMQLTRNSNDGKYIHVDFKQFHNGKEVLFSRVMFRFSQDLKIVMFGIDGHRNIPNTNETLTPSMAISKAENAVSTPIKNSEISNKLFWFPFPGENNVFEYKLCYSVTVNTQDDKETPGKYLTYVDATNGDILYRQNKVVHVDFKVKADAYPTNLFAPLANLPLKNLLVKVGTTNYYTDFTGLVSIPGTTPVNPNIQLSGKYIKIVTGASGTTTATYAPLSVAQGDSVTFPQSAPDATERHTTCYYHANEIHDFMKTRLPSFTAMDNPLTARVDRTDGNCNAFYDGSSINFYTTSNGCNALSLVSDVMYHEYGHGITNVFWSTNGSSFDNGGQGEGYSDVWAMGITKSPIIGPGFTINQPNSNIRRYDINPKVYPQNIVGEVHADGEIIAGAWWDFAINLGGNLSNSVDTMSTIFADSHYGLATGPDGTEGVVYHDILIDALQYDDDNNNLNDGTPHFAAIVQAFAKHGIYLLSQTELAHNQVSLSNANVAIPIQTIASSDFPAFLGNVKMFFRKKGSTAVDSLLLTKTQDTVFNGSFTTPTVNGDIFEYYFTVYDYVSTPSVYSPNEGRFSIGSTQRNLPYLMMIGYNLIYNEDFTNLTNTSANWKIGGVVGDGVTTTGKGKWEIATPISSTTNGEIVQTGKDHTTGTGRCAVTGNASSASASVGSADIDGGRTTLITQEFDLSQYSKPVISYWRWFSNSQGSNPRKDQWRTWGSYNNGATWFQLERTFQPDVAWRQNVFSPNLSQGSTFKLMFVAIDTANATTTQGALVEAAIDDIQIFDIDNSPASISSFATLESKVYPNPAQNMIHISTKEVGAMNVSLLNTVGSLIYTQNENTSGETKLNVNNIPNGIYFLRLNINQKTSVHRITIQR